MREITRLTISFLYLIFLLSVVGCVQELNVTDQQNGEEITKESDKKVQTEIFVRRNVYSLPQSRTAENETGFLFQLTPEVTTCADIYAGLLTKPLSNPLLGSLPYSDTQETIPMNYIMYESDIQNNTCLNIQGTYKSQNSYYKILIVTSIGLVITPVTVGALTG